MHTFHDFIATKSCPCCTFVVVYGQLRVYDRKSAGRMRVGLFCGAGRVRVVSVGVRGLSGHDFWNSCGCGAVADKKFNPCRTLISSCQKSSEGSGSLRTKSCQTIKQTNLYWWLRFTSGTCGLAFRFRVNVYG